MRIEPMPEGKSYPEAKMEVSIMALVPIVAATMSAAVPTMLPAMRSQVVPLAVVHFAMRLNVTGGVTIDGKPCIMGSVLTVISGFVGA